MSPMDRRQFIKVTAITGTSAALARCGNPEHQIIRFIPDEDIVPGVATWKPSICPLCRAGCGVIARVMEGEAEVFRNGQPGVISMGLAKKLEGDPQDPVSQGKLCARGQAAIQVTYHPERLGQPMRREGERGSGRYAPVSWDEAIAEIVSRIDAVAASGASALAFIGRPRGPRRLELVTQFLERFGALPPVTYEAFSDEVLRRANALSFGVHQMPTVDLGRTGMLVSFGADFLGTWNSPVAQSVAYGAMRQGGRGARAKFVQVEPRMSTTGASADEWLAVRPGTEGVLALGLAHVLIATGVRPAKAAGRAGERIDGWSAGLADYAPDRVARVTGLDAAVIERLAREMASHAPAVAIVGGAPLAHTNGLFHALAVNALNALVGSVGQPGGVMFTPGGAPTQSGPSVVDTLQRAPKMLLLDEANPVFGAPPAWKVAERLGQVPFIASFGSFLDETSVMADLILPDHSFLESWVDATAESGAARAASRAIPPVMRPLHQTRAMPDVLIDISRRLATPITPPLAESFEAMVAQPAPAQAASTVAPPAAPAARFSEPRFDGDAESFPFHFLPYPSQALLDGSLAHLPWLQEMPDPLTSAMWSSWVEINPQTAARLGIALADVVEVASAHGALRAPAFISPAIAPDVIAMPVGQGHRSFTRVASGRGANPLGLLGPATEESTGSPAWAATRVRVVRAGGPDGSLILFAGATRERPDDHTGRG